MATKTDTRNLYEELAGWYDGQGQAKLRDWFLVLAADAASSSGESEQAERLRKQLLHVNPHHLLRPFGTFAEALEAQNVQNYIADLRRDYPLERAEQLLRSARAKPAPAAANPAPAKKSSARPDPQDVRVIRTKAATKKAPPAPAKKDSLPTAKVAAIRVRPTAAFGTRFPPAPTPVSNAAIKYKEEATLFDYWVAMTLFVLTLLASIGLAFHAFGELLVGQ